MTARPSLSVVVPVLDEERTIGALVRALRPECDELIVVDGGSTDRTRERAAEAGARVLRSRPGRGPQLHLGAQAASGEVLWFLHADSEPTPGLGDAIRAAAATRPWGCCQTRIRSEQRPLHLTAALMTLRARLTGSCTGDMGIWCRAGFYEAMGGFCALPAFEDLDFSDRARQLADWAVVDTPLTTSDRRWQAEGLLRTTFKMWRLRAAWNLGRDPEALARQYTSAPR